MDIKFKSFKKPLSKFYNFSIYYLLQIYLAGKIRTSSNFIVTNSTKNVGEPPIFPTALNKLFTSAFSSSPRVTRVIFFPTLAIEFKSKNSTSWGWVFGVQHGPWQVQVLIKFKKAYNFRLTAPKRVLSSFLEFHFLYLFSAEIIF